MRKADHPYSQTWMALFKSNASLMEKYNFRGICFLLTLRWLQLRHSKNNAQSVFALKDNIAFTSLWKDFAFHSANASKLKSVLSSELDDVMLEYQATGQSLTLTMQFVNTLKTGETDTHIMGIKRLRELKKAKKGLTARRDQLEDQLSRMFFSKEESAFDLGTPAEQIMRKLMSLKVKNTASWDIEVVTPGGFFSSVVKKWDEIGKSIELAVQAYSGAGNTNKFEIGLYGNGAHSVGAFTDKDGVNVSFFDPNFGVFESNGKLNKFRDDVANLLKDKYPKMSKIVLTYLV